MRNIVFFLLVPAVVAFGRVILVPDSAATIQAGLGMASSGDTVLVKPGTYAENLTWPSIDGIRLLSVAGPESTIVDGQHAGVCLTMTSSSLKRATLVRGFTFANGYNAGGGAAGIACGGEVSIVGNRVTRCNGVGIYLYSYSTPFSPLVTGNEIDGCFKDIENYNYGCGMYIDAISGCRPEVCFNYIHHDTLRNSSRNYGGGIYCNADALIYQNTIEANVLYSDTGLDCRAYGAGIYVDLGRKPIIFNNLIKDNRCATDAWKYGAGIRMDLYARPFIINNTIVNNVCAGPHMWSEGGGIYNDIGCTTYVRNNIIANNQATSGSGIYNESQSGAVISTSHNDYYNNALYGCSMGSGDISGNPLFVTGPQGDYCLSQAAAGQTQNSPCLDAGDTLEMTTPLDLDALLRTWTTRTDSIIDMDALDMGYHYPGGILLGVAEESFKPQAPGFKLRAVPNPFRTSVTLALEQREREGVRVRIFDAQGRIVAELSGANTDRIVWNAGSLPAGVYCYRVVSTGRDYRGRLVKTE